MFIDSSLLHNSLQVEQIEDRWNLNEKAKTGEKMILSDRYGFETGDETQHEQLCKQYYKIDID